MPTLFTTGEKFFFESCIDDIHDTFARPITVISEPNKTIILTSKNPLYGAPFDSSEVDFTPSSTVINARILYGRPQNEGFADGTKYNDVTVDVPAGWVRIKIAASDYDVLRLAKRVTLDGLDFSPSCSCSR